MDAARELLAKDARGFSTTAGIFMTATAALDPTSLPSDAFASLAASSPVFLVDADPASPDAGKRTPVKVSFDDDGGPYGAPHLLTVLPYQGRPLRPGTRYAAVVTTAVRDASGASIGIAPAMADLAAGRAPAGVGDAALAEMRGALDVLRPLTDLSAVAAMAVFRTDTPLAGMETLTKDVLSRPAPQPDTPLAPADVYPDYCVYSSTIKMPDYQAGDPPFTTTGGQWAFDGQGNPVVQRMETANVVVTLPRAPMPPAGFPTVVFSSTGAGGDWPLVDRGVQAQTGGPAITPGTGPAQEFARAGFAAITIDGPLEGLRNTTHGDEDFLIFNISNPGAIRDNIRQSALELVLAAHVLDDLTVDATACTGLAEPTVRFDTSKLALMGHSMGATISPLAAAFEPRFGAVILSGCGGSFIDNVVYKQLPVPTAPLAEVLIGYAPLHRDLTEADPALSLVQWAAEAADPVVYGSRILGGSGAPHSVLMVQGIVDHYIMPPMANSSSLSFGLDVLGPTLDDQTPELAPFASVKSVLPFSGRSAIDYPAQGNVTVDGGGKVTAVVTQAPGDGVEDGHEVVFQTRGPKYQYRCFLSTYAKGAPRVPAPQDSDALCP